MLFNSADFLFFFPLVTAAYFAVPHRWRWLLLLVASCWFYMAFVPVYILILAFTIVVDYAAAILIARADGRRRKAWLMMSLIANVGVLMFFKYWNFLAVNLGALGTAVHWSLPLPVLAILLPIGLSFHTFQAMSYTIEVYRGRQAVERHLGIYALYVMFYPQLVAGPIERPQNLLHQFRERHQFDADRAFSGLARMLWGMFKKVVIADRLAVIVNQVYNQPHHYPAMALVWATWLFAIQIFCDFSGYSDIALGAAQVMGFRLMENFDRPYFASSIAEFWRRWHMSLSTWFKDYVYLPLGGSRVNRWRLVRNVMVVFLISGLWHGAAWTFVIWGALHGAYLTIGLLTRQWRDRIGAFVFRSGLSRLRKPLGVFVTFNLVAFAWIFFRANSLADATVIVGSIASAGTQALMHGASWRQLVPAIAPFSARELTLAVVLVGVLIAAQLYRGHRPFAVALAAQPAWTRWSAYYAVLLVILSVGLFGNQTFIYFQF